MNIGEVYHGLLFVCHPAPGWVSFIQRLPLLIEMPQHTARLTEILQYIRSLQPREVVPRVLDDGEILVSRKDVETLPGIQTSGEDDVWLKIGRLTLSPPPKIPAILEGWVDRDRDDTKPGKLRVNKASGLEMTDEEADPTARNVAWANYLNQHAAWRQQEMPRILANEIHSELLSTYRDLKMDGGAETMEVVCGIGMVHWKTEQGHPIRYPLFMQPCELVLNEDPASTIEIHLATVGPSINIPLLATRNKEAAQIVGKWWDELSKSNREMTPFEGGGARELALEVISRMDPMGRYINKNVPTGGPALEVDANWAFFVRRRSNNRIIQDIKALQQALAELPEDQLPGALKEVVDRDISQISPDNLPAFRGLEHAGMFKEGEEIQDLYFPLPYNDEQVSIVQKLESSNGVVVQGPPGTGKSHTIANIICHYLAKGKSILVSAGAAGALEVVRDKMPEDLRPLTAALLSSDAESIKQFELSITTIASRVSETNIEATRKLIEDAHERINMLHEQIREKDEQLQALARRHLTPIDLGGKPSTPVEVAATAVKPCDFTYVDDTVANVKLMEVEDVVEGIATARADLGNMVGDPDLFVSLPSFLPAPSLARMAASIARDRREIEKQWEAGSVLRVKLTVRNDNEKLVEFDARADELINALADIRGRIEQFIEQHPEWVECNAQKTISELEYSDPFRQTLLDFCQELVEQQNKIRSLEGRITMNLSVLGNKELLPVAIEGIENLMEGKRAFPLLGFGKYIGQAKEFVDGVIIDGKEPETPEHWKLVRQRIADLLSVPPLLVRWNNLSESANLPELDTARLGTVRALRRAAAYAQQALYILNEGELRKQAEDLGRQIIDRGAGVDVCRKAIEAQLRWNEMTEVFNEHMRPFRKCEEEGGLGRNLVQALEQSMLSGEGPEQAEALAQKYHGKLEKLRAAQLSRVQLEESLAKLEAWGARNWAKALRDTPPHDDGTDPLVSPEWKKAWLRSVARQLLLTLGEPTQVQEIFQARYELTDALGREYSYVINEQSWLRMAENSPPRVRQALQKYLGAVRKIGTGNGVRAARHRVSAQEAMEEAHGAIPCWIMPQGRVSESMPAQIGLFDLVILDEASQSSIDAMLTIMRGKKVLIVGDDKQVSPSGVGHREKAILEARHRFLSKQPYSHKMLPDQSIYDLFSEVFAGNNVMLKEHFRSTEAIIEYSNREYYGGQIIPLRVPDMRKRITPPLVDVLVRNGRKVGDVNVPEATFIVQEIARLVRDPAMNGRSIGVVTLTSNDKQSMEIKRQLAEAITAEEYRSSEISVGPPPQFQGKERDIMFVSMVWDARSRDPGNRMDLQQRFNVALSRARDRMYLVRSIPDGHAKPGNLLDRIIRHFQDPFMGAVATADNTIELCDTPFERQLARFLVGKGYRVMAKVGRRGFQIDLVVEGANGNRLAIECDGDRAVSPQQWADSLRRQRILERAGWKFWRCFQAHWEADSAKIQAELIDTLTENGILTGAGQAETGWVRKIVMGEPEADMENVQPYEEENADYSDASQWESDRHTLMEMCESPFEKDVLGVLLDWGYRVFPQFPLRGYRIDFMVQDMDGNRLAVECDGDSFHGLDQMKRDTDRQTFLENSEDLSFWRCFYSDYRQMRGRMIANLKAALDNEGVQPWPEEDAA